MGLATIDRAAATRTRAPARGMRSGVLRRRGTEGAPRLWMGDVNNGVWFAEAELPRWLNGPRRRALPLAFAQASLATLSALQALMIAIT